MYLLFFLYICSEFKIDTVFTHSNDLLFVHSFSILVLFFFRFSFLLAFFKPFGVLSQFSHCTLLIFTLSLDVTILLLRLITLFLHHAHHIIAESDFFSLLFLSVCFLLARLNILTCVCVLLNGKMPSRKHLV